MRIAEQAAARRASRIQIAKNKQFDLIVIGGGVHGAYAARQAAHSGLSVLLLEARDFAGATSSRSSKLLHGGIRYLEQGSFFLVRQALRQRAYWCRIAPHLTRPLPFLFPIIPGQTRPAWQVRIGLAAYDLLSTGWSGALAGAELGFSRHQKEAGSSPSVKTLTDLGLKFSAAYRYFDAQMDDARLVLAAVSDSEVRGGTAINYARVVSIDRTGSGWQVSWRCGRLSDQLNCSSGRYLINCCGPWAAEIHKLAGAPGKSAPPLVWSRGVHLYFKRRWSGPGLILPTGEAGRIYWILPFLYGGEEITFVGTTDRPVNNPEHDPKAAESEIEELLGFLNRDLPAARFGRDQLIHTICGIRTLVGSRSAGLNIQTSAIGREEEILFGDSYSALFGGKFTTAPYVADQLLKPLRPAAPAISGAPVSALPGAGEWNSHSRELLVAGIRKAFSSGSGAAPAEKLVNLAVFTLGTAAAGLIPPLAEECPGLTPDQQLLQALLEQAALADQAWEPDDFLERRIPLYTLGPENSDLMDRALHWISKLKAASKS